MLLGGQAAALFEAVADPALVLRMLACVEADPVVRGCAGLPTHGAHLSFGACPGSRRS